MCSQGVLKVPWKDWSHWMKGGVGSPREAFYQKVKGWGGYAWCVTPQQTQTQVARPNPAHPMGNLPTQLHRLPHLLLLQTPSHMFYLLHRYFWEATTSFYHLSCFIAGLTDFIVILLPPGPKLSVLSQMARKEATSLAVEDSVLVAVLWLHWPGEVAAAWRVTAHKIWGPGMPSEAEQISKILFHKCPWWGFWKEVEDRGRWVKALLRLLWWLKKHIIGKMAQSSCGDD